MDKSLTDVPGKTKVRGRTKIGNVTLEVIAPQNAHELYGDGQWQHSATSSL
jgi:hypothetical protein